MKRGFFLIQVALCLTIIGMPVIADQTTGAYTGTGTPGLKPAERDLTGEDISFNPVILYGSPSETAKFTMKQDMSTALYTMVAPIKIPEFSGTAMTFRPDRLSGYKTDPSLYNTLLDSFRANPRSTLSPPGGNTPLYCSGGY
jgi:hypothetical protein